MAKQKDAIETAKSIFDEFLSRHDPDSITEQPEPETKDKKRQAAGRKGGQKGGKARATKLSAQEKKKIAKRAAETRWRLHEDDIKN